jgi:hypothetical protein
MMFEKPPIFRQFVAECRGPNNPTCAVATANTQYAIVTITGDVTNATFEARIIR